MTTIIDWDYSFPLPRADGYTRTAVEPRALMTSPLSGTTQFAGRAGGRWRFQVEWYTEGEERDRLEAFFIRVRQADFRIRVPMFDFRAGIKQNYGKWSGTTQIDGAGQLGTQIDIKTGVADEENYGRAGDLMIWDGTEGVKMLLNDVDTDAGGLATMNVFPPVRIPTIDSDTILFGTTMETICYVAELAEIPVIDALASGKALSPIGVTFVQDLLQT